MKPNSTLCAGFLCDAHPGDGTIKVQLIAIDERQIYRNAIASRKTPKRPHNV